MKERTSQISVWPTALRYLRTLRRDVSFRLSLKMLVKILAVAAVVFFVIGVAGRHWADVYDAHCPATQTWKEFLFGLLGSIDAKPEAGRWSVLYSVMVRLLGAIVIGGIITSFLCALVERFAEMKLRGLLVPVMREHFVVVGCGGMTDDLIRALLAPESPNDDLARWVPQAKPDKKRWQRECRKRQVLLCTGGDVEKLRETLEAVLPRKIARRIVYAFGEMDLGVGRDEVCERLTLQDARQIYVLGDETSSSAGDVANLAFAKGVGAYLAEHRPKYPDGLPKPVFVRLDGGSSFDFVKKISFETDATEGKEFGQVTSFFKPFSFTEGWARRMWSDATAEPDVGALDFAPMGKKTSVHLVVAGLTPMGEALVLQAVRVCHFPNGRPTRITVFDPDPSAEDAFFARHPSLRDALPDVRIEFRVSRIESEAARGLLRDAALDEGRLLTVAVCFRHSDAALSAALNLPEEVFWHRLPAKKKTVRDAYRENGPRIRVFQEHRDGLSEQAKYHPRYENLLPFGMQEGGFAPWCLQEFAAMYLNAVYDWPKEGKASWLDGCRAAAVADRIAAFRAKWAKELAPENEYGVFDIDATEKKDLLRDILAAGGDEEVRRFQEYALRKYVLLRPELRWANTYVSDSYGIVFRALGLRATESRGAAVSDLAKENDRLFSEARSAARLERGLDEVEHARWMADRALLGFRAPRPRTGEVRDDDFRYHGDMVPFDRLSASDVGKDELSIGCIPLIMALQGIRLEQTERTV